MTDRQSVIDRLRDLERRINEIIDLIGDRTLRGAEKQRAQELLRQLKDLFNAEHKRMSTARGEAALSQIERTCYAPVIAEAKTRISVKTNSIPNHQWINDLHSARIDVTHMLHQLEHPK